MQPFLTESHVAFYTHMRALSQRFLPDIRKHDALRTYPRELIAEMAAVGLLGLCLPKAYGGGGRDYLSLALAAEAMEYADASLREVIAVHLGLHALAIYQWGTAEQKQRWLPGLATGSVLGCFALNEANAGSDVANMRTTARKDGDGYVLNGAKTWITLATQAQRMLVFAKTEPERGAQGISAFIVPADSPGVQTHARTNKMGDWASDTGDITLTDVRVPATDLLGFEGEGFKIAMSALDNGRFVVAAGAIGSMKACRDEATAYAKERLAFGAPIIEQQLVQQLLANMQLRIDAGEMLVLKTASLKNAGRRNSREASSAKWFCAEAALQCANDAVRVLGSAGYSDDHNAARHLRNCMASAIYQGTSQIHTLIQADYLSGKRVDKPLRMELPGADGA